MQLRLERRPQQSRAMTFLSPVLAIVLSVVTFFIIFALMSIDPLKALYLYFIDPLTAAWSVEDLIVKAAPIILIAVGLSFCYQSNVWNIGAEGQSPSAPSSARSSRSISRTGAASCRSS